MAASLTVKTMRDDRVWFCLQWSGATATQAEVELFPYQREEIGRAFQDFADCLEGPDAEGKLRGLGEILYSTVLPLAIQQQIRALDEPLVILTDDPTLPWEVLHDGDQFLSLRLPLTRQLMIRAQLGALLDLPPAGTEGLSALIIADPTCDLPRARAEGEALYDLFQGCGRCKLLLGDDATSQRISLSLVQHPYSIVHFCGHVDYDPVQRAASIRLRGGRLPATQIHNLFRGRPLVFLNACLSDQAGARAACVGDALAEATDRTENVAQAFMLGNGKGAASAVVGTMWAIPDLEAVQQFPLMFYKRLLAGATLSEAMRGSRAEARRSNQGPMVWAPYVLYGEPDWVMPTRLAPPADEPPAEPVGDEEPAGPPADEPRPEPPAGDTVIGDPAALADSDPSTAGDSAAAEEARPPAGSGGHHGGAEAISRAGSLDTSGREVFLAALREMEQMRHKLFSSLHLLLGLCLASVRPLEQAFQDEGVTSDEVCLSARRQAARLLPQGKGDFAISRNVAVALQCAARQAQQLGKSGISAEDLLAGLLQRHPCEATEVLAGFGIDPAELLRRLPALPAADYWQWRLGPAAAQAMHAAIEQARETKLGYLGTGLLLAGLIDAGDPLTKEMIRAQGVSTRRLAALLKRGLAPNPDSSVENPRPTRRCARALDRAAALAEAAGRQGIGEADLLQAILEDDDPHSFTLKALRSLGADPAAPLAELRRRRSSPRE